MALGKQTSKTIEFKFYNYEKIKAAVVEARARQESKGGITGGGNGHSRISDPTASIAINHATPITHVTIKAGLYEQKIYQPEKWIRIVEATFGMYTTIDKLTGEMARRRYLKHEDADYIADTIGISRATYYVWREDFLQMAGYFAVAEGVLNPFDVMK